MPIFDGLIMRHLNIRFQVLIPMVSIGFCYRPGGLMQPCFARKKTGAICLAIAECRAPA